MVHRLENIQISEKDLNTVKKIIGFPVITNEFDYLITEEHIKDYSIAPALHEFYRWFPMKLAKEYTVTSNGLITEPCPEMCIGLVTQQFVPNSSASGMGSLLSNGVFPGNPFATANQISIFTQNSRNYGTPYSYENNLFTYQQRFLQESIEASNSGYYVDYNEVENTITLKSLINGVFYIEFAIVGNDVNKIPFRLMPSFIKYSQSLLLENLANILGLSETELPSAIDVDRLIDKSDKLKEEVLPYWREASKSYVMR